MRPAEAVHRLSCCPQGPPFKALRRVGAARRSEGAREGPSAVTLSNCQRLDQPSHIR